MVLTSADYHYGPHTFTNTSTAELHEFVAAGLTSAADLAEHALLAAARTEIDRRNDESNDENGAVMTLDEAIGYVVDDVRTESPDREWTVAEAIAFSRDGVTFEDVTGSADLFDNPELYIEAYQIVLSATDEQIDQALAD